MKLHIGSRSQAEGWKSFDIQPGAEVDYVGSCTDLSQFADGSIEAIYASHVLEHLSHNREVQTALREWHRVLAPQGIAMISVPDLEVLSGLYLHPQATFEHKLWIMRMMFGGQMDANDFHRVGFSLDLLGLYLHEAGFPQLKRVKEFGLFEDTSRMEFAGVPISLNVIARKSRD